MSSYPTVTIRSGNKTAGAFHHPWIYRSHISQIPGALDPGSIVDVKLANGRFVGRGYYNAKSEITIRILTRQERAIDKDFVRERLETARELRRRFVRDSNAYRLISNDADGLPGLIIDDYAGVYVVQVLTQGMERLKPWIFEALQADPALRGIYEKSDATSRKMEGLQNSCGWIVKNCGDETTIVEGGAKFSVQFEKGHKTGFYLDQRENRLYLASLGIKGSVLDAFCYSGGFGIHLARAGAKVTAIDSQDDALEMAAQNARLNALNEEQFQLVQANVFDELKKYDREKKRFDAVILDPPSFVKGRDALAGAMAGFKEIILRSMKILNPGGLLAAFSCSYHMDETLLLQTSMGAAIDTHKNLKIIKFMKQSQDHPIDPFIPESYYLKGFLFLVS